MRCDACGLSHHEDEAYTCANCLMLCFDAKPNGPGGHYGFYDEEVDIWSCDKCTRARGYCDDDLSDSTFSTAGDHSTTTLAPLGQLSRGHLESNSPNLEPRVANDDDAGQGGTKAVESRLTSPLDTTSSEITRAPGQPRDASQRTSNSLSRRCGVNYTALKYKQDFANELLKEGLITHQEYLSEVRTLSSQTRKRARTENESLRISNKKLKVRIRIANRRISTLESRNGELQQQIQEKDASLQDLRTLKQILNRLQDC